VSLLALAACGDRQVAERAGPSRIEKAIASDLSARFGTSVVSCVLLAGVMPLKCIAKLADGTELPIAIEHRKTEWEWRVDGLVIDTKPIVSFVQTGLAGVHVNQTVDCGPPVIVIQPGERVVCKLAGGGAAFVAIDKHGEASLELALDPASAAARTELLSADRDRELTKQSKELETLAGESDGEEAVPAVDGGVP
jgi:hypothetical protein